MARATHVTGIDIGSSTVRIIVAKLEGESGQPTLVGIGTFPMRGMQKGVITDVEEAVRSVSQALDAAERMGGLPVERGYVSINGSHISSQNSRGVIAVSRADGEISPDDIARVINAAQAISLPSNREILHVLPQNFIVDGQEHIHDPVGMTGVRLEVETHVIEGSAPFIKNLTKVINQAGVHIEDFVFSPLAAALSVLDKRQKELGTVLVDLGAGTTSLAVYEENTLLHTAVLPLGSSHITNDIAIGLRTSIEVAEAIKLEHGTALTDTVKANETIMVEGETKSEQESVSRKEVANIISARLEEIFTFVDRELKQVGRSGLLPAGAVFTGGGAHLPGVIELAKKRLRLPARIGKPESMPGIATETTDPAFAVATGLVLWAFEQETRVTSRRRVSLPDMSNTIGKIRGWFKTFLP
jgi:cell division protein FtsA